MGDGLPDARTAAAAIVDRRAQTLSSCIVNGKLNLRRLLEFQKRSYEEFASVVADLLDTNSLLLQEGGADEQDLDEGVPAQQTKKTTKGETCHHVHQPYHWRKIAFATARFIVVRNLAT